MSIVYTEVKKSALLEKAALYGANVYHHVKIHPTTTHRLALPSDYEFSHCFLPKKYLTFADRVLNFKIYPDDVWTVSFPKAGTTWIMNTVWQLRNNLNFSADMIEASFRYIDRAVFYDSTEDNENDADFIAATKLVDTKLSEYENLAPPRILKSHLPAYLLPKDIWSVKPKLIYVYRDAKDVALSTYHMYQNHVWLKYAGTKEDFLDAFVNDHVIYGPFYDHVRSFKQLSKLDHVLLIKYEDMIADPFAAVKKISEFLNCSYDDDQLQQLTEHVSFENMRKKDQAYQNYLSNGFK